jgi:hypothetical protein
MTSTKRDNDPTHARAVSTKLFLVAMAATVISIKAHASRLRDLYRMMSSFIACRKNPSKKGLKIACTEKAEGNLRAAICFVTLK